MADSESDTDVDANAERVSTLARQHGFTIAVAESLTGGKIAESFSAASDSGAWFAGAVVSYRSEVKFRVLGVRRGPVVTEDAVTQMAAGVADLMQADAVIAASGVGGPGPEEGKPAGTTWLAVRVRDDLRTEQHHFDGEPIEVLAQTRDRAIQLLLCAMRDAVR